MVQVQRGMNKLSFQSSELPTMITFFKLNQFNSNRLCFSEDINQIKDSLWFHMYDEMIEDIPSTDELMIPATEIYQKISSHYLGELIIPFSTIFASQRVSHNNQTKHVINRVTFDRSKAHSR